MPEHRVLAVEMGLGCMAEEELTSTGVATGMGHREGAGLMLLAVDLAGNRVARSAGASHGFGALPTVGTAALGHEAVDHPMKGQTVVEALLGQLGEIGHRAGGLGIKEIQVDQAGIGFHQSLGHRLGAKADCIGSGVKRTFFLYAVPLGGRPP